MSKILTYKNSRLMCFCTIQLDNGDKIFISISQMPKPKISVYKSRLLGLLNSTIWEFTPEMAGGYEAYIRMLARAFVDLSKGLQHPLDVLKDLVMSCRSTSEVIDKLFEAERRMNTPHPDE